MSEEIDKKPIDDAAHLGAFSTGDRVTVIQDPGWSGPWQREFEGVISDLESPVLVEHPMAQDGEMVYWVDFDEPQYESNGDGPYRRAQIWGRYLRKSTL